MEAVEVSQIQKQVKTDYKKAKRKINEIKQLYDELNQYLPRAAQDDQILIQSPNDVFDTVKSMGLLEQEEMWVLNLNSRNRLMNITRLYRGSTNSSQVRLAELFRGAIMNNAVTVILVHNHPSGDPTPSTEDIAISRAAIQAGKILDLEVLDHIVVGRDRHVSLKERGLAFVKEVTC